MATFPSYWLNRKWAWGKHGRSHFMKEVVPFWVMAGRRHRLLHRRGLAGHATSASQYHLDHFEQTVLVLVANVMSFGIFWVLKLFVFNRLFRTELEEFDEHLTHEEEEEAASSPGTEPGAWRHRPPLRTRDGPRGGSVPEVVELQRDPEVLGLALGDDLLEVVTLLAVDPELVALGL